MDSEVMGEIDLIAQPVVLDRTPSSIRVAPPERGNATEEILLELGIKKEELNKMRDAQII